MAADQRLAVRPGIMYDQGLQGAVLNTQGFEKNMQTLPSLKQIYGTTMTELTTFPRFQA